jgi:hypothetical protein
MNETTVAARLAGHFFKWVLGTSLLFAGACSDASSLEPTGSAQGQLAGANAAGSVPAGLPARLMVGLFEDAGSTWMQSSGAQWDVRYRYFVKGWVNNWGWSPRDGSWGLQYLRECDAQGYLPAVQYYQIYGEPGGGEEATYAKTKSATTMAAYFADFKILMQRVKEFGKPTLILIEADAYGFLQHQTSSNSGAYAAVAATGLPELAGLPDTVAGWGLAFLQLKKAVGAGNALLGIHISGWASGKDIAHSSISDALSPEVDKVYGYLAPFGLTANVTGQTYDFLVGDPLDRDADYYKLVRGEDRWWDTSDSASISSRSFNRYAEWLRLWNQKAARRWILWQIPLGNSNHRNVVNDGSARAGYRDNRPEYFFGSGGDAHRVKFADAGVIALLFGAGAEGQSSYQNDQYTDGQPFMKAKAGAFLNAGGLSIGSGSGSTDGTGGSGGTAGTAGTSGSGSTAGSGGSGGSGGSTSTGCEVSYEAEVMTHEVGGAVSGGWNLWSNGGLATSHAFAAGSATISVVAAGTPAAGAWPHLVLETDGAAVGEATVASGTWQTLTFTTSIAAAGTKTLRIAFDNDYLTSSEDRNLLVDRLTVAQSCTRRKGRK